MESAYINAGGEKEEEGSLESSEIRVHPMFGKPYSVEIAKGVGGHGGGDTVMLNDIFGAPAADPLCRAASHIDGAKSILTGIAANKAIAGGQAVRIRDLIRFDE